MCYIRAPKPKVSYDSVGRSSLSLRKWDLIHSKRMEGRHIRWVVFLTLHRSIRMKGICRNLILKMYYHTGPKHNGII